jgi:hypothetical protein
MTQHPVSHAETPLRIYHGLWPGGIEEGPRGQPRFA